jgi:MoxR-like ATPase
MLQQGGEALPAAGDGLDLATGLLDSLGRVVVGQRHLLDRLLIGLLANGHILIEGVPGVGKTLAVTTLAQALDASYQRIQFTPDLLPADLIGTLIYQPQSGEFRVRKGPIFANLLLADEINRAPAKVQSALLEAMQEGQVTIGSETHRLPRPFLVLATQNPLEHDGTYPLPEAQVDRFMVRLELGYPSAEEEAGMLAGHEGGDRVLELQPVADRAEVLDAQDAARRVHASKALRDYIVALLHHTRGDHRVELGASPRAGLMLLRAAKARALLQGRDHALPDDVQALTQVVLPHRIMLVPEAAGIRRSEIVADAVAATPAL